MAVGNKGSGACCCFGCGRRSQSCHAQCEEYREYLKSNAEKRNAHLKERLALQGYKVSDQTGNVLRLKCCL